MCEGGQVFLGSEQGCVVLGWEVVRMSECGSRDSEDLEGKRTGRDLPSGGVSSLL